MVDRRGRQVFWAVGIAWTLAGCSAPNPLFGAPAEASGQTSAAMTDSGEPGGPGDATTTAKPPGDSGMAGSGDGTGNSTTDPIPPNPPPTDECPDNWVCEVLPKGWEPVARAGNDSPDLCPMGSDETALLESEPFLSCDCGCEIPEAGCALQWQLNAAGCAEAQLEFGDCAVTSGADTFGTYVATVFTPVCEPVADLVLDQPSTMERICRPNEIAAGCGAGQWCTPPDGGCLIHEGEVDCPAGFPRRRRLSTRWSDPDCPPECLDCEFGCDDEVVLWEGTDCGVTKPVGAPGVVVAADGACHGLPPGEMYYSMSHDPDPVCVTAQVVPVEAIHQGVQTLCCRA